MADLERMIPSSEMDEGQMMIEDESPLLPEARAFQTDNVEQEASTQTLLKTRVTPYSQTADVDALRAMQLAVEDEPLLVPTSITASADKAAIATSTITNTKEEQKQLDRCLNSKVVEEMSEEAI